MPATQREGENNHPDRRMLQELHGASIVRLTPKLSCGRSTKYAAHQPERTSILPGGQPQCLRRVRARQLQRLVRRQPVSQAAGANIDARAHPARSRCTYGHVTAGESNPVQVPMPIAFAGIEPACTGLPEPTTTRPLLIIASFDRARCPPNADYTANPHYPRHTIQQNHDKHSIASQPPSQRSNLPHVPDNHITPSAH